MTWVKYMIIANIRSVINSGSSYNTSHNRLILTEKLIVNDYFHLYLSATAIPRWIYQFSFDHWSQATSGPVSTWMGDRLGTPGAVGFLFFLAKCTAFLYSASDTGPGTCILHLTQVLELFNFTSMYFIFFYIDVFYIFLHRCIAFTSMYFS